MAMGHRASASRFPHAPRAARRVARRWRAVHHARPWLARNAAGVRRLLLGRHLAQPQHPADPARRRETHRHRVKNAHPACACPLTPALVRPGAGRSANWPRRADARRTAVWAEGSEKKPSQSLSWSGVHKNKGSQARAKACKNVGSGAKSRMIENTVQFGSLAQTRCMAALYV